MKWRWPFRVKITARVFYREANPDELRNATIEGLRYGAEVARALQRNTGGASVFDFQNAMEDAEKRLHKLAP